MQSDTFEWLGRIIQDGQPVAKCSSTDKRAMLRELLHYAAVYGQDGPATMQIRTGKNKWKDYSHVVQGM